MLYYIDPTQTEFFINETSSLIDKSVLAHLYHVLAVKYKKMWVVVVKITENVNVLD